MKKILLIEDNVDLAENISSLLEKDGYIIQTAFTGEDGLSTFIDFKPDLILCDILLPGINGYSVLKRLKKMEGILLPIFIFITAKNQRDELRQGMVLGADDYITKPFTHEELLLAIKVQFEKRTNTMKKLNAFSEMRRPANGKANAIFSNKSSSEKEIAGHNEYIFLKSKKETGFHLINKIIVIKSLKDYTNIYLKDDKSIMLHRTLVEWEKKLPAEKFLRIHKQTLINRDYIENIEQTTSNRFLITLINYPKKLEVSQRYSRKLKKLFQ
ncbi:MAG: response regulator [Ignavibacteriales bacterium]|nr:response regulator [Ignavibacteriales bacterium]